MKNFLGYFLHSEQGRRFVIQVPGVSTAQLGDEETAELINWLLLRYSAEQLPKNAELYTAAEVKKLRSQPEATPEKTRQRVLAAIADDNPEIAESVRRSE